MQKVDLTGLKFSRLTVVSPVGSSDGRALWHCVCDCGVELDVRANDLTSGNTKSCGCLRHEASVANIKGQRRRIIDMTGRRYGRLVVQEKVPHKDRERIKWVCLCDCGNTCIVLGELLRRGTTTSCGCFAKEARRKNGAKSAGRATSKRIDLTGQRFGRLFVKEVADKTDRGQIRWRCVCDCGAERLVTTGHLRSGHTKSCGCLGLENATKAKIKHGGVRSKLYGVYCTMKARCNNPNSQGYEWYGAKGITLCAEWQTFAPFKEWAESSGYKEGLSIDRIDPDKGYSPDNCEWVTRSENIKRMHAHHKHKLS